MRLAYCTGMRRCACSTKTTPAITSRPTATTNTSSSQPWLPWWAVLIDHIDEGKRAAIWVKIRIDMPLPTPRSVMSSPILMISEVPAVIVRIITMIGKTPSE